jgi:hypothetical protein
MLNTNPMTQKDAQQFCFDNGGHLPGYDSLAEQIDVEQTYIKGVSAAACLCAGRQFEDGGARLERRFG